MQINKGSLKLVPTQTHGCDQQTSNLAPNISRLPLSISNSSQKLIYLSSTPLFTMLATRRSAATAIIRASRRAALFHSTRPSFVKVGDGLPDLEVLTENSPGNKVNLAKELKEGKGLIIGSPGAFSKHIFAGCFFDLFRVSSPQRIIRIHCSRPGWKPMFSLSID